MRIAVIRFAVTCPVKTIELGERYDTKVEAKRAIEAELRSRKLTKPMTLEQLNVFCEEMYKRLEFKSESERLADIIKWAEGWQSKNLPPN
jgi:hypothetical protein